MNKTKIGQYLRKLRSENKMSQSELANKFSRSYINVSTNAISKWERGETIPDIDKLNFLSDLYNVSVDDILNGERYDQIDFDNIYHIHHLDYFNSKEFSGKAAKEDPTTNPIYYAITKEGELIRNKFKKHILDFLNDDISRNDTEELVYFLKNFFVLNKDYNVTTYFAFLRKLKHKKISNEEKWWEVQRYIHPIETLRLSFSNISDEEYLSPTNQKRMNYSEAWEKDALLSMIQVENPVYINRDEFGSKSIEKYEKERGKSFDTERITKDTIRYLINSGAMINRNFLSYQVGEMQTVRVVDTLENAHNKIIKPIPVCIKENNQYKFFYAENNIKNRFYIFYEYYLVKPLLTLGYTYEETFDLVNSNKEIPDEVYIRMAEVKGINKDRDIKYIKADANRVSEMFSLKVYWKEFHNFESENLLRRDDIEMFEEALSAGQFINTNTKLKWVGGLNIIEKYKYIIEKKENLSYQEFKKGRQQRRTQELLDSLDSLSLEQIRNKFFQLGGQEND